MLPKLIALSRQSTKEALSRKINELMTQWKTAPQNSQEKAEKLAELLHSISQWLGYSKPLNIVIGTKTKRPPGKVFSSIITHEEPSRKILCARTSYGDGKEGKTKTVAIKDQSYINKKFRSLESDSDDKTLNHLIALIREYHHQERIYRKGGYAAKIEMILIPIKEGKEKVYLIMEHLVGTTLDKYVKTLHNHTLPLYFLYNICVTLSKCHALRIIHKDIKPENIFVEQNTQIRLLDFGFSREETTCKPTIDVMGTCKFMPPESMVSGNTPSITDDLWALGILIYKAFKPYMSSEMKTAFSKDFTDPPQRPATFSELLQYARPQAIKRAERISKLTPAPHTIDALIQSLLALNPAERPSWDNIFAKVTEIISKNKA